MKYDYIDTHAHVNINAFKDDWQEVILRTREAGVAHINVGTQQDTSMMTAFTRLLVFIRYIRVLAIMMSRS